MSLADYSTDARFRGWVTTSLGPAVLLAFVGLVTVIITASWVMRWWKLRSIMHPYSAGALRYSAARGDIEALDYLSTKKMFDVDSAHDGWTALLAASVCNQPRSALWLLAHGADLHAVKSDGWNDTALHYAAAKGWHLMVLVLLVHGADRTRRNFNGDSPLDLAIQSGCQLTQDALRSTEVTDQKQQLEVALPALPAPPGGRDMKWLEARRWDSYGVEGTVPYPQQMLTRFIIICMIVILGIYVGWRATRTINDTTILAAVFSGTLFFAELCMSLQFLCSLVLMWQPITREERDMYTMDIPEEQWPSIDIFVVTYSESVTIVKQTVCAALNLQWPVSKLTVHIMDDGRRQEMEDMFKDLRQFHRGPKLCYTARPKVKGVHHHAKAGNINHTLTKESSSTADFVLVLDCDM